MTVRELWINRLTAITIVALQIGLAMVLKRYLGTSIEITLAACILYKLTFERAERT